MMSTQLKKWLSVLRIRAVLGGVLGFPLIVELVIKINEFSRLMMHLPPSNQFAIAYADGWTNMWRLGLIIGVVFLVLPTGWLNKIFNHLNSSERSLMNTQENTGLTLLDVINATDFTIAGFAGGAVRAKFNGAEGGFCTTSYSYSMSNTSRMYAAQRIALLLDKAVGLSNEQIESMTLNDT